MAFSTTELSPPLPLDFQRLGIRRMEFRPQVIRRAVYRAAHPLVLLHRTDPDGDVMRLLSDVLISGYRVLDPRRREDPAIRVMLGRIHPQLVDEAVSLAQLSSRGGGTAFALRDDAVEATSVPAGESALWEIAESVVGSGDRPSPRPDTAATGLLESQASLNERFSDAGQSPLWQELLSPLDLTAEPLNRRAARGFRRHIARSSMLSLIASTLLIASLMLVLTWRMTVRLRHWNGPPPVVEMAGPSPESSKLAAAGANPRGETMPQYSGATTPLDTGELRIADTGEVVPASALELEPAIVPPAADRLVAGDDQEVLEPSRADTLAALELQGLTAPGLPLPVWPGRPTDRISADPIVLVPPIDSTPTDATPLALAPTSPATPAFPANAIAPANAITPAAPAGLPRPTVPPDSQLVSARLQVERRIRAMSEDDLVGISLHPSADQYNDFADTVVAGSSEHFVARLLAGRAAVLLGDQAAAADSINRLVDDFEITPGDAVRRVARWIADDLDSSSDITAWADWVQRRMRFSLSTGDLDLADDLATLLRETANRIRTNDLQSVAKRWRDALAICRRYADVLERSEGKPSEQLTADEAGMVGRYYALVRRDWHQALPYLAASSTPKLTRLAGIELLSVGPVSPDEAATLADGYLGEAKKMPGWVADSYAAHVVELLRAAADHPAASATAALETRRRAEAIARDFPDATVPLEPHHRETVVHAVANLPAAAAGDPPVTAAGGRNLVDIKNNTPAMLGRIRVAERDVGILVRYQPGLTINADVITQLVSAGGAVSQVDLSSGQPVSLEFIGQLTIDTLQTAAFEVASGDHGDEPSLEIDGQRLPVSDATDLGTGQRYEIDFEPGIYKLRWRATFSPGSTLRFHAFAKQTSEPLELFPPPLDSPDHPALQPTRARVELIGPRSAD